MYIFNILPLNLDLLNSLYLGLIAIVPSYFCGTILLNLIGIDREKYKYIETYIGLSIIILVCQNLVYLNVPIKYSGPLLLGIFIIFWLYLVFSRKIKTKIKIELYPLLVLGVLFAVWFINGTGYLRETSRWYKGSGWADQYNYTVTAEFLKDYRFSMNYGDVTTPYLYEALAKKGDRIGQSIYHAFISSITNLSADRTYGGVSLLAPVLVYLAFMFIFSILGFNKYFSVLFSFMAGVLPSISVIHLENFFSQALGTPILYVVIFLILIWNYKNIFSFKGLFIDSLLVALLISVYTEYLPFVLVAAVVIVFISIFERKLRNCILYLTCMFSLSVLLNILYWPVIINILKRTNLVGILSHVYPFNHTWYGYQRLFFGDLTTTGNLYLILFLVLLVVFSLIGFLGFYLKKRKWQILILPCFPLVSLLLDYSTKNYPYQTYKLLLSFIPILIIGLGWTLEFIFKVLSKNYLRMLCLVFIVIIVAIPSYATLKLSNMNYLGGGRSIKPIVNSVAHREIYDMIENSKDKNFFLAVNHPYELAWMTYYGRNNNLWFLSKVICDMDISGLPGSAKFISAQSLPDDIELVNGILSFPKIDPSLSVFGYIDGSIEGLMTNMWSWIGKEMKMNVYAKKSVKVNISFQAYAGPANKSRDRVLSLTNTTTKKKYSFAFTDSLIEKGFNVDLVSGDNKFIFEVVKPTEIEYIPANDQRVFMVTIHNLAINPVNKGN